MTLTHPRVHAAGVDPGQRALNGPQTTGREYRNLSEPTHRMRCDQDVAVAMRDGVELMADVHRPESKGRFPALVAASPYPRQIQDLGAPMGFIEAGATDFWVPRGYAHVIANLRGTGGSGGTFGFFDAQERQDLFDLVEWAAVQPWCDGKVGMIGISYFAMAQLEAAVERPPHLKAIFPVAVTTDLYEAASHHGLFSSGFVTPFLAMVGLTSGRSDRFWRSELFKAARSVLHTKKLHHRFATMNGEAAVTVLHAALKLHHDPHPWDDLWQAIAVEHPLRDTWWEERDLRPLLDRVEVPTYLGCDWDNVPLHLPSTFSALHDLVNAPVVRVGMLGAFGLTWPWESLHLEALAWYDHWLKGHDTGILDGPPIRYWMPGADEWRTSEAWPPAKVTQHPLVLRADGRLGAEEGTPGKRSFLVLGPGLGRSTGSPGQPPRLEWTSEVLGRDLDVVGDIELDLHAAALGKDYAVNTQHRRRVSRIRTREKLGGVTHAVAVGILRPIIPADDMGRRAALLEIRNAIAVGIFGNDANTMIRRIGHVEIPLGIDGNSGGHLEHGGRSRAIAISGYSGAGVGADDSVRTNAANPSGVGHKNRPIGHHRQISWQFALRQQAWPFCKPGYAPG